MTIPTHLAFPPLPNEVFVVVMRHLSSAQLVTVSQACSAWARCAEVEFQRRCKLQHWRLPRRPRGVAKTTSTPWRTEYLRHCCLVCHELGEWPVYTQSLSQVGVVCYDCYVGSVHLHDVLRARYLRLGRESVLNGRVIRITKKAMKCLTGRK